MKSNICDRAHGLRWAPFMWLVSVLPALVAVAIFCGTFAIRRQPARR